MFANLLLHPQTKAALEALASKPPHALLLTGPAGIGNLTLARAWAKKLTSEAMVTLIAPDEKGTIGIAAIRELYQTTRSKQKTLQVVCFDNAESMSTEAQNAFLKLLEEPREGLIFVLCASSTESLLPTIISRVQHVTVRPIDEASLRNLAAKISPKLSPNDLAQVLFIANGRPGLFARLLNEPTLLEKERSRMQQIKSLLTAEPFERYLSISKLATDRDNCTATLKVMARISSGQLMHSRTSSDAKHWLSLTAALEKALHNISNNGSLKAQLLLLFSGY